MTKAILTKEVSYTHLNGKTVVVPKDTVVTFDASNCVALYNNEHFIVEMNECSPITLQ